MRGDRLGRFGVVGVAVGLLALGHALGAPGKGPVKVFIMAGQSNMAGQAHDRTINFLGEDKDPAKAALLKTFKPDGTNFVKRDDVWVASGCAIGNVYDILQTGLRNPLRQRKVARWA